MGLHRAGYEVTGVDIEPQPNYPFEFIQGDALEIPLDGYDLVWASPPCQKFSVTRSIHHGRGNHSDLIDAVRSRLHEDGSDFIIENVPGAPLRYKIQLCGSMFGLDVYRHRIFEISSLVLEPWHPPHTRKCTPMGRPFRDGEVCTVVGHFVGLEVARKAMGIDWMTVKELSQAIPPAYSEFLAAALISD